MQMKVAKSVLVELLRLAPLIVLLFIFSMRGGDLHSIFGDSRCQGILVLSFILSGVGIIGPLLDSRLGYQPPCVDISRAKRAVLIALCFMPVAVVIVFSVTGLMTSGGGPVRAAAQVTLILCACVTVACTLLLRLSRPAPGAH